MEDSPAAFMSPRSLFTIFTMLTVIFPFLLYGLMYVYWKRNRNCGICRFRLQSASHMDGPTGSGGNGTPSREECYEDQRYGPKYCLISKRIRERTYSRLKRQLTMEDSHGTSDGLCTRHSERLKCFGILAEGVLGERTVFIDAFAQSTGPETLLSVNEYREDCDSPASSELALA